MKRFYKDISVAQRGGGFALLLDGKPVLTPAKKDFVLPTNALAEAVADEWRGQGEEINAHGMSLTRLSNTVLDGVGDARAALAEAILRFGENDLLCYRSDHDELSRRQREWDALLDWAADHHHARLEVTRGLNHIGQPARGLDAFRGVIAGLDDWQLAGLQVMASITSSLVLGLAVLEGRLAAAEAFHLSRLDEEYQAEKWGMDSQAQARARILQGEMEAAALLVMLTRHQEFL